VLDDVGPVVGGVIAGIAVVWILVMTLGGIIDLGKWFTLDTYRVFKYERHGVCGICKKRYTSYRSATADQTYGPDLVTQGVCPNGHVSVVAGNRKPADWAGF
jgi:hypothetical protein